MTINRNTTFDDLPFYLRIREVAKYVDGSDGLIREEIRRGSLAVVKIGRLHRIRKDDLKEWLTSKNAQ
jgi:excisionase family DNA binding protein